MIRLFYICICNGIIHSDYDKKAQRAFMLLPYNDTGVGFPFIKTKKFKPYPTRNR